MSGIERTDIESHIAAIGRALWARDGRGGGSGRATVMIGAGFSKNAVPEAGNPRPFPTWKDLAAHLIDQIQPGCEGCTCLEPDVSEARYPENCTRRGRRQALLVSATGTSGMMELGQKFEATKGPALLHGVLQRAVPDLEYGPGKPHQDLVRLPWADILTTNWDTLLEQAVDAYDRSYELVVQPKQLATATAPRIVKLHGCVRSGTKLIFTEEDFRTYPSEYAPFVSLVQQSLMENAFVLIGFSGADPNFKAWHGWVRDHLRKYLQPVYLVTNKVPDSIDVSLFSERLVTVVDLSLLGVGSDYAKMLEEFFRRLRDYRFKIRENLNWPRPATGSHEKSYAESLKDWRTRLDRRTQWIVLPTANRIELNKRLHDALELASKEAARRQMPDSGESNDGQGAQRLRLTTSPAFLALFQKNSRREDVEEDILSLGDREKAAVLVAEMLKVGLARPGDELLNQLRNVFAETLLDLFWPEKPSTSLVIQGAAYDRMLDLLAQNPSDQRISDLGKRVALNPTEYRTFVMRLLPLIEVLEREERWSGRTEKAAQLTDILRIVDATGAGAELSFWSRLQCALDMLNSAEAANTLTFWTPRPHEAVSMLRHAAGLRELGQIAESELEVRQAVDLLRRLATVPHQHLADASREAWAFAIYSDLLERNELALDPIIKARGRGVSLSEVVGELAERLDELEVRRCDPRRELDRLSRDFAEAELRLALRALGNEPLHADEKEVHWIVSDPATTFMMLAETVGISVSIPRQGHVLGLLAARMLARERHWLSLTLLLRAGRPSDIPLDSEIFDAVFPVGDHQRRLENGRVAINHLIRLATPLAPTLERRGEQEMNYVAAKITLLLHIACGLVRKEDQALFGDILDAACRAHDSAIVETTGAGWTELIALFQGMISTLIDAGTRSEEPSAFEFLRRILSLAEPKPDLEQSSIDTRAGADWPDPFRILAWESREATAADRPTFILRDAGKALVDISRNSLDLSRESEEKRKQIAQVQARLSTAIALAGDERRKALSRRLAIAEALLADAIA